MGVHGSRRVTTDIILHEYTTDMHEAKTQRVQFKASVATSKYLVLSISMASCTKMVRYWILTLEFFGEKTVFFFFPCLTMLWPSLSLYYCIIMRQEEETFDSSHNPTYV